MGIGKYVSPMLAMRDKYPYVGQRDYTTSGHQLDLGRHALGTSEIELVALWRAVLRHVRRALLRWVYFLGYALGVASYLRTRSIHKDHRSLVSDRANKPGKAHDVRELRVDRRLE